MELGELDQQEELVGQAALEAQEELDQLGQLDQQVGIKCLVQLKKTESGCEIQRHHNVICKV